MLAAVNAEAEFELSISVQILVNKEIGVSRNYPHSKAKMKAC